MKVLVKERCWYNDKLYDPEVEGEVIIDYAGEKCPSWGEVVGNEKAAAPKKADEGKEEKAQAANKVKVKDLPVVEKNALLEAAKAVGIEGNQILSWNADTLKAKIEAKKADEGKEE
ncbi:MAG: hypothetical protein DKM22_04280 [Candidatus Melainabacteria bacterium]|nr:MAG: hypothetical protein DKM22_04280 [Candidatus Melainabacteria bacterium]